jgi:excisionase family DNA binding protein
MKPNLGTAGEASDDTLSSRGLSSSSSATSPSELLDAPLTILKRIALIRLRSHRQVELCVDGNRPTRKETTMNKLLLKPAEAAELLGVGRSTLYELLSRGDVPSVRLGRSIRVPFDALRNWVAQQSKEAAIGNREP